MKGLIGAGRRIAQGPGFTHSKRKQVLVKDTKEKLQALAGISGAGHSRVNMEEGCNSDSQSSVAYLSFNTDKYKLMTFASVFI